MTKIVISAAMLLFVTAVARGQSFQFAGDLPEGFGATILDGPTGGEYNHNLSGQANDHVDLTLQSVPSLSVTINQAIHTLTQPATATWTDSLAIPGSGTIPVTTTVTFDAPLTTTLVSPDGPLPLHLNMNLPGEYDTPDAGQLEAYNSQTTTGHWTIDAGSQHLSGDFSGSFVVHAENAVQGGPLYRFETLGFPTVANVQTYTEVDLNYGPWPTTQTQYLPLFNGAIDGQPWTLNVVPFVYFVRADGSFHQLQPVPEPSTIILAALGGLALLAYRRRGR